jgi:ankyrin repeat protein
MPKKSKKSKSAEAAADLDDDNFNLMLAEVKAADPQLPVDDSTNMANSSSSSSSSSSSMSSISSGSSSTGIGSPISRPNATILEEAIVAACKDGSIAELRRLKRQGARVRTIEPLICSLTSGANLDILRFLVKDLGADVSWTRTSGATALSLVALQGNIRAAMCLVKELGADVDQAFSDGTTALLIAAQMGQLAMVRCLIEDLGAAAHRGRHDGATPLYHAVVGGHLAIVRYLIKEVGADVNQAANNGITPLFVAATNGQLAIVRFLVKECGADVNKTRQDGGTPLMTAASNMHGDIVAFLIKYGANTQSTILEFGTAADISRKYAAPAKQTQYLEARTHCANTGCDGAGIKKCAGCLKIYYCARECQLAHWSAHKAECRPSGQGQFDITRNRT